MTDAPQSTEIAVPPPRKAELVTGGDVAAIVPRDVNELMRYARWVCDAGLAPPSYEVSRDDNRPDPTKVALGIAKGAELGMPPMLALSTICIINKRPCLWGDGVVALLQRSGRLEWWKEEWSGTDGMDSWTCTVKLKRADQSEPYTGRFSVKDAKRANLWANPKRQPWIQYPSRMLGKRALAFAARDGFADVLSGLSIAEEVQDVPPPPSPVSAAFLDDTPVIEHQPAAMDAVQAEVQTEATDPVDEWEISATELRADVDAATGQLPLRDLLESKAFADLKAARTDLAKPIYDAAMERIRSFGEGRTRAAA